MTMGRPASDDHRDLQDLLPWYVSGQLDAAELAGFETHLHACGPCQAELKVQRQLETEIKRLPMDVEQGWSQMRRRLEQERVRERRPARSAWAWLQPAGAGARGWGVATGPGLAMAGVLMIASAAVLFSYAPPARYHALSAAAAPSAGNALVMFRPDIRERDMRDALAASGARLVDGPTAAGAYVLQVPAARRADALARLRARPDVELAEPVDPAGPER